MSLVITATPATYDGPGPRAGFHMVLCDANKITVRHRSEVITHLDDVRQRLDEACAALEPEQSYLVSASWVGGAKPPRGFKAASARNEFIRRLNRTTAA